MSEKESKDDNLEIRVCFVNRCTKVMKGGRRFSFSALVVAGNGKGTAGWGFAKARSLSDSIRKAENAVRKNLIQVPMVGGTIPLPVETKVDGVKLLFKPLKAGGGLIAGDRIKLLLNLAGYKDLLIKNIKGKNPKNQILCVFKGWREISDNLEVLKARQSSISI